MHVLELLDIPEVLEGALLALCSLKAVETVLRLL